MARIDLDRRLALIVGLSLLAHGGIAAWALLSDAPAERPLAPAVGHRVFAPDLETVAIIDADHFVLPPDLTPGTAAPVATPPVATPPAPHVATRPRARRRLDRVPDPSPRSVVNGLFGADRGAGPGGMARRAPGADLAHELEAARARGGSAAIGGGGLRTRHDGDARIGTSGGAPTGPQTGEIRAARPRHETAGPRVTVTGRPPPGPTPGRPGDVSSLFGPRERAALARCWKRSMVLGATSARVDLALTIGGDGTVSRPVAGGGDADLDRCVQGAAAGWHLTPPRDEELGTRMPGRYRVVLVFHAE